MIQYEKEGKDGRMKTIVLCGSMKVKDKIIEVSNSLNDLGYNVLLPIECMEGKPKDVASRAHFNRIIDKSTDAILVINEKRDNIDNYIGPNTFAEIAFAYFYNKDIYLLKDIYEPYIDELEGWKAVPIHNDLSQLKD